MHKLVALNSSNIYNVSKPILMFSISMLLVGCASYSEEELTRVDNREKPSLCVNMEPAQELKCKEREKTLALSIGKNCNSPYAYERNRCQAEQGKKEALLKASIKKHEK